jgi:hypothetical protein
MALVNYSHAGFFVYSALLLAVESLVYRDRARAIRGALAASVGVVAALPLTWESWRYPGYFTFNNVTLDGPAFAWEPFVRKLYYNVEIVFLPWRWFNDFTGLATLLVPVVFFVSMNLRDRTRPAERPVFYACAALVTLALTRFNTPEFGYAFLRPLHLLAVFPVAVLAWFLVRSVRAWLPRAAMVVLVAVYLQYLWMAVPHVPNVRAIDPDLVDYLRSADGAMVLLENTFHRDMDADPSRESEKTPFAAHLEGLLVPATGKRFYAGVWDGWQWSPFRHQLLSGGAFHGKPIASVPPEAFVDELRRWGIAQLLVWSEGARAYLNALDGFSREWQHGLWVAYRLRDADTRDVTVSAGTGRLLDLTPLGARVHLSSVRQGEEAVVRTNFYPAWRATAADKAVPLFERAGQLAFRVPCSGDCEVVLEYPRRPWLTAAACAALIAGFVLALRSVPR